MITNYLLGGRSFYLSKWYSCSKVCLFIFIPEERFELAISFLACQNFTATLSSFQVCRTTMSYCTWTPHTYSLLGFLAGAHLPLYISLQPAKGCRRHG